MKGQAMHDEPGPLEPDVRAQAWTRVQRAAGYSRGTREPILIKAICVALLDLRDRKMDRLP